jgi:hypothetical protein
MLTRQARGRRYKAREIEFDGQERAIVLGNFLGPKSVVWLEAASMGTGRGVDSRR